MVLLYCWWRRAYCLACGARPLLPGAAEKAAAGLAGPATSPFQASHSHSSSSKTRLPPLQQWQLRVGRGRRRTQMLKQRDWLFRCCLRAFCLQSQLLLMLGLAALRCSAPYISG